jgi:subtilisin family serine protease
VGQFTPRRRHVIAAVLVGVGAVAVTGLLQGVAWLIEQGLILTDLPRPAWLGPLAGWVNALVVAVPSLILARWVPAAGRVWARAALLLGGLSTARAVPIQHNTAYLFLLAGLATAGALALRRPAKGTARLVPWAVAAGLGVLIPWLCLAALGGPLETLGAATAAAALGWLAARLLATDLGPRRAPVAAVALTLLAGGTGLSGVTLAALVAMPALGIPAAVLSRSPVAVAVLVGLGAFGPLAFVEPVQTSVVLGLRDVGWWALIAAAAALVVGLLFGLGYGLGLRRRSPRRWIGTVAAAGLAATALTGCVTVGHPGMYGDSLFVVLKTQADLSDLAFLPDVKVRRAEAYRRLVETADRTQAALRRDLTSLYLPFTPFYLVNGLEVAGDPAIRAWLSQRPEVDRVLLNPVLRPIPVKASPLTGRLQVDGRAQWNITAIGAVKVWAAGVTGPGIVIGISDSGVDGHHPALAAAYRGGEDSWYDPWDGTTYPTDDSGHGTHVLGTAVGNNGIGVAPGARWIGCVDLPRNLGNPASYLRCLQFMLAPFRYGGDALRDGRPDRAADVLINSWGCPQLEGCDAETLRPAVSALALAGIFVVAAAGNTGPRCGTISSPPATYRDAFTVGAADRTGQAAGFSSRGPGDSGRRGIGANGKPDLVAPGVDVVSALPGGGYGALAGTSMAAPHVAGVVALMWAANPKLVGDLVRTRDLLLRTATPVPGGSGCGGAPDVGAGLVNADAAVRAAHVN